MARQVLKIGSHFMTGEPPIGMGFTFYVDEDQSIVADLLLDERHEGPPNHVHGGFSAALLDEVMGTAVWQAGFQVVAVNIEFDLRAPVPLGQTVTVRGWVEQKEGRKVYTRGTLTLADGRVAVAGRGLFIEAPHLFEGDNKFTRNFKASSEEI